MGPDKPGYVWPARLARYANDTGKYSGQHRHAGVTSYVITTQESMCWEVMLDILCHRYVPMDADIIFGLEMGFLIVVLISQNYCYEPKSNE